MADNTQMPHGDDLRHDDLEFNPQLEPKNAKPWLNLLEESETAFEKWNDHCDKIDKLYANLERLAGMARDKEFQMFYANCEVIKPSIYARPPQPVVVTKFKDRRPVYQAAAELLQRCDTVAFDLAHIDPLMKMVRDDVALIGRGVAWCRYESGASGFYNHEKVCVDFKFRKDFLHSVSRCWAEVTWVAGASYLTRSEARDRFKKYSGDCYQDAEYTVDRDSKEVGGTDNRERAKFWEIWDKTNRRVVWVAKGCEDVLDEDEAHLELQDFFPCPCPAYGVIQRGSLVPVPDVLQYKDQLDELNLLTAKIHALSNALEAKGFYPAGGAEIGDAVAAAIATQSPGRVLVPISNWAAFGGSKEIIVWLPMAEIAQTITHCIGMRKEIIQDIYQIIGLSDIMRGATDARETLGAQELKSQFGSTRIKDKQLELVRMCRDLVGITSDIILDKFDDVTIIQMSQTQLVTDAMKRDQLMKLMEQMQQQQAQVQQLQSNPQAQQLMQKQPELMQQVQQLMAAGTQSIESIMQQPTFEQVMHFLRDQRSRAFVLDIETDSTIMIDEATEKQARMEFTTAVAQLLPQMSQMIMAEPATAPFCGEFLKFSIAPYRAGRAMDGAIDNFVAQMEQKAGQPKGDDPTTAQNKTALQIEQMKDAREREKNKADSELQQQELQQKDDHAKLKIASTEKIKMSQLNAQAQDHEHDAEADNLKLMQNRETHQQKMILSNTKMQEAAQKMGFAQQAAQQKSQDAAARSGEKRAEAQFRMTQPRGNGGGPSR